MFVVDDEEKEAEKEGGNDVTQDDFPLEIVEVRDGDVDDGGETEEENTDAAADGVDQSEGPAMFLEAIFSLAAGTYRDPLPMRMCVSFLAWMMNCSHSWLL